MEAKTSHTTFRTSTLDPKPKILHPFLEEQMIDLCQARPAPFEIGGGANI